jgi:hypothetical protein
MAEWEVAVTEGSLVIASSSYPPWQIMPWGREILLLAGLFSRLLAASI